MSQVLECEFSAEQSPWSVGWLKEAWVTLWKIAAHHRLHSVGAKAAADGQGVWLTSPLHVVDWVSHRDLPNRLQQAEITRVCERPMWEPAGEHRKMGRHEEGRERKNSAERLFMLVPNIVTPNSGITHREICTWGTWTLDLTYYPVMHVSAQRQIHMLVKCVARGGHLVHGNLKCWAVCAQLRVDEEPVYSVPVSHDLPKGPAGPTQAVYSYL